MDLLIRQPVEPRKPPRLVRDPRQLDRTPRRQHLVRSRLLGEHALWEAACQLVPDGVLQRQVITAVSDISYPEWFPATVSQGLRSSGGMFPRLKTALVARLTNKEAEH